MQFVHESMAQRDCVAAGAARGEIARHDAGWVLDGSWSPTAFNGTLAPELR